MKAGVNGYVCRKAVVSPSRPRSNVDDVAHRPVTCSNAASIWARAASSRG